MSDYREMLAAQVREALGEHDDAEKPVVVLVRDLRAALDQERADNERLRSAAKVADWEQVRLNGGPPCFHIEDGTFCLRAERWPGHPTHHKYVTLHAALLSGRGEGDSALGSAAGRDGT